MKNTHYQILHFTPEFIDRCKTEAPPKPRPSFAELHRASVRARRSTASPKPVDPALEPILFCGVLFAVVILPILVLLEIGVLGQAARVVGALAVIFIGLPALAIAVAVLWIKLVNSVIRGVGKVWRGE